MIIVRKEGSEARFDAGRWIHSHGDRSAYLTAVFVWESEKGTDSGMSQEQRFLHYMKGFPEFVVEFFEPPDPISFDPALTY